MPLKVKLADENERLTFTVFPMARYDVILGRPWLTKNNPQINYRTNQVKLESGHQWTARLATEPLRETPDVELNFITGKQARHSLRQGEGFFAWVSSSDSPEKDVEFNIDATGIQKNELLDLLNEYRDVLP